MGVLLLLGGMVYGQNKEVLIVEQYPVGSKYAGIYLYWDGKEPEKVAVNSADFVGQTKVLASTFARLYKEGWKVAAMNATGPSGTYIFEREKP